MLLRSSVAMLFACFLSNGHAGASPISRVATPELRTAAALAEGGFTAPPKAFYLFCAKFSRQCVRAGVDGSMALNEQRWSQLVRVNERVNRSIKVRPEPAGIDVWKLGAKEGDCDAFAIQKRKELMDLGWSASALLLTVVYPGLSEAHLVLTVRTDHGEFVLDNLRDAVLGVEAVGYQFVMRQSAIHPRLWVSIERVNTMDAKVAAAAPEVTPPRAQ